MNIKYIILHKFKRFPLMDSDTFEHYFNSRISMISGPNGSGKSSLFNELTPLPADRSNYEKGGYKEIHIEFRKQFFILRSDFTSTPTYSFKVDGEELNTSGNQTNQRELVKQYFDITPAIHNVLVGAETFTDMSLQTRKKLLNSVVKIDVTKLLERYTKCKELLKEKETIKKSLSSSLMSEEIKLAKIENTEVMKRDMDNLTEQLNKLLEMKTTVGRYLTSGDIESAQKAFKTKCDAYTGMIKRNITMFTSLPAKGLKEYQMENVTKVAELSTKVTTNYKKILELETEINSLRAGSDLETGKTEEELKKEVEKIKEDLLIAERNNEHSDDLFYHDWIDIETVENEYAQYTRILSDYASSAITSEHTQENALKKQNELTQVRNLRVRFRNEKEQLILKINSNLELIKNANNLSACSCERCGTMWKQVSSCPSCFSPETLGEENANLQKEVFNRDLEIQSLNVLEKDIESWLEQYATAFSFFREVSDLIRRGKAPILVKMRAVAGIIPSLETTQADSMLKKINHESFKVKTLYELLVKTHSEFLPVYLFYRKKQKDLLQLEEKIRKMSDDSNRKFNELSKKKQEIEIETYLLELRISQLKTSECAMKKYEDTLPKFKAMERSLIESAKNVRDLHLSTVCSNVISVINDEYNMINHALTELKKSYYDASNIEYAIKKLKDDLEDTETHIEALNGILSIVSPKDGIIANSISNYLNNIVNSINFSLSTIWGYKMELVPIDIDNEALNYRFKINVEDSLEISDISIVSKGMKEAINLCFKLTLYSMLNMAGFPVYMDELAANLDQNHTSSMISLLKTMAESSTDNYGQIFIITHKENFSFIPGIENIDLSMM